MWISGFPIITYVSWLIYHFFVNGLLFCLFMVIYFKGKHCDFNSVISFIKFIFPSIVFWDSTWTWIFFFFCEKKNRDFDGFSIFGYMYTPDILSIHKKELNFFLCLVPIVIPHCLFIIITLFHCSELIKYLGFPGPVYNLIFSSFFQLWAWNYLAFLVL